MVSTLWTQFFNTEIWIKLFEYIYTHIKTNLINSKTLIEKENSCVQVVAGSIFHGLVLEYVDSTGSTLGSVVKIPLVIQEAWVWAPGQADVLEKEMATHSSILAWRIPWTEKSGGLQSSGSQRVRRDWVGHTQVLQSQRYGFGFWLLHLLDVWPWLNYFNILYVNLKKNSQHMRCEFYVLCFILGLTEEYSLGASHSGAVSKLLWWGRGEPSL